MDGGNDSSWPNGYYPGGYFVTFRLTASSIFQVRYQEVRMANVITENVSCKGRKT